MNSLIKRYKTGRLDFDRINPINEGLTFVVLLTLSVGIFGVDFLTYNVPILGIKFKMLFLIITYGVVSMNSYKRYFKKYQENWNSILAAKFDFDFAHKFYFHDFCVVF